MANLKTLISLSLLSALLSSPALAAGKTNTEAAATTKTTQAIPKAPVLLQMSDSPAGMNELLNPFAASWGRAQRTTFPLYKQNLVVPFGGGSIKALTVQALKAKEGVLFRLEWEDATKDNDTVHQTKFRDAAAIEFPIGVVEDTVLAMGSPHGPVNIWQWKADWEPDAPVMATSPYEADFKEKISCPVMYKRLAIDSSVEQAAAQGKNGSTSGVPNNIFAQSAHKSPVEDIIAIGISSVSTKPAAEQALKGRGEWKDGRWHVVIFKPMDKEDDCCKLFQAGKKQNLAFAVWNGSQQDRNGMKSISNWASIVYSGGSK